MQPNPVLMARNGPVWTVTLHRPEVRNAVDGLTARALADAFREFESEPSAHVAVLTGAGGHFCAGADLRAVAQGQHGEMALPLNTDLASDGPMGPSRLQLSKPVIAAVSGYAVAGGLELALWCDLRVVDETAVFGVFCRRWGVPLIDGGTVRLPRLIGESRALDLILTGRPVDAEEALQIGLANRKVPAGQALAAAQALAAEIAALPQQCLRNDRASTLRQAGRSLREALAQEFALGLETLRSGEAQEGAARFAAGAGRHGTKA
ncbi:crotonase/enoyl-CoA hydratase family protein [Ideonella sp. BN130291]|uniref:crotonase/enoyl-CoA hydratase family protein n=1 Tax=Ideonella sp. BN130291 TaxID=3112940 RepID=UPI002E25EB89|nr:crotonase/enoyl-CoA hydratase family protein [Ideonella sp. BN130291]